MAAALWWKWNSVRPPAACCCTPRLQTKLVPVIRTLGLLAVFEASLKKQPLPTPSPPKASRRPKVK